MMTAGEETQRFNSWAAEQQCMKQVNTSSPHTTAHDTTRTTTHAWRGREVRSLRLCVCVCVCVQVMDGFAGSSTSEATLGWISEALDQAVAALTEVRRRCCVVCVVCVVCCVVSCVSCRVCRVSSGW